MKISFCMIVRDEADLLVDCLASVRDLADELIVVDTGSTDGTQEVARKAGAKVFDFVWCDDFAAARNASLDHASGDWVLYLDADERLVAGGAHHIRAAVEKDDFDCGFIAIHNAKSVDAAAADVLAGTERIDDPVLQRRLLRRTPDLRFSGLVHEHLGSWLAGGPKRTRILPVQLIHLGYATKVMEGRQKLARNLELLERQVSVDPGDFMTYGYLAHAYLAAGKADAAWEAIERGWSLIPNASEAEQPSVVRLASVRAQMQLSHEDPEGAIETLTRAIKIQGESPDFDFLLGQANALAAENAASDVRERRLALAVKHYKAAIDKRSWLSSARYVPGASSYRAQAGLGRVELRRGNFAQALQCFGLAAEEAPDWPEAQIGRVKALMGLGDEDGLLYLLTKLEGSSSATFVSALVAEHVGSFDDFGALLDRAKENAARAATSTEVWEELYARYLRLAAYRGRPSAGTGVSGSLCAILAGEEPSRLPVLLDELDRVEAALFVRNLLRLGRVESADMLSTDEAEQKVPGIGAIVQAERPAIQKVAAEHAAALAELESTEQGTVSVVVLTWNQLDATKRCIDGLRAAVRMPMEIIAVDNGSTDGTVEYWQEQARTSLGGRAPVRVIFNPDNRGFPVGCNQGLAQARGDYVLFLNNDAIVHPGTVERLAAWLRLDPKIGLVGARSNYAGGEQMIAGAPRSPRTVVESFADEWVREHDGMGSPCLRLLGLCLMGRRDVFERVGGFDPRFTPGNFEDDDLCVRVARAGYRVWLAHDSFVDHEGHRTIRKLSIDYQTLMERNQKQYFAKWGGAEGEALWKVSIRAASAPFDPDSDYVSPAQDAPWPISSDRPRRLLAWPRWDLPAELAQLLRSFVTLEQRTPQQWSFCLRLDPESDIAQAQALQTLGGVAEKIGPTTDALDILLIDDPMDEDAWPRLGSAITAIMRVQTQPADERRERFLRSLGRPSLAPAQDMAEEPKSKRAARDPNPVAR